MKKFICFCMALSLAASPFTGCDREDSVKPENDNFINPSYSGIVIKGSKTATRAADTSKLLMTGDKILSMDESSGEIKFGDVEPAELFIACDSIHFDLGKDRLVTFSPCTDPEYFRAGYILIEKNGSGHWKYTLYPKYREGYGWQKMVEALKEENKLVRPE